MSLSPTYITQSGTCVWNLKLKIHLNVGTNPQFWRSASDGLRIRLFLSLEFVYIFWILKQFGIKFSNWSGPELSIQLFYFYKYQSLCYSFYFNSCLRLTISHMNSLYKTPFWPIDFLISVFSFSGDYFYNYYIYAILI